MLDPGLIYVEQEVRFDATFTNSSGVAADPDTVKFRAMSPSAVETALEYGSDAAVQKTATGKYTADFTPDEAGQWWYRWETTGTGLKTAIEGHFNVQHSPFFDPPYRAYRR